MDGLEDKDFQTFRNEAVKHPKQGRGTRQSAPATIATNTFTKLKCNFNICATDISTATATRTSFWGIYINHPRDSDACKPGHPTHSAEPSGNQRTAGAIQRSANFLPSSFDDQQAGPRQSSSMHHQLPLLQAKKVNTTYQDSQASPEIFSLS